MDKTGLIYRHPRKAECLCGSGKKFKRCCADRYKEERSSGKSFLLYNENRYKDALIQCRADITRYTIWHRSHTEPPLRDGFEPIKELLYLDIKALSEMVNLLLYCYEKNSRLNEFPAVLERLRNNIKHSRWHHRITYFHSLCALLPDWNVVAGRQELNKIGSINDVEDVEILQLYLDLFGEDLPFPQRITIIEKVINLAEEWIDILHYKSLKAIQFLLINEVDEARLILTKAVDEAKEKFNDTTTAYEAVQSANAIWLLSTLAKEENLLDEAIQLYQKALKDYSWKPSGLAEVHRCIGDAWRYKEKWELACSHYEKSLELSEHNVSLVFLAECHLHSGNVVKAESLLNNVQSNKLDRSGYWDYIFIYAALSVELGERSRLEKAEQLLKSIEIKQPYFQQRKQDLLISILECKSKGSSNKLLKRTRSLLKGFMLSANRYLMLQPNFMGLGLNVNRILNDSVEAHRRKDESTSNKSLE